jgi:predicted AlkP superfamily pyrophosphatase or phosphodiesterase
MLRLNMLRAKSRALVALILLVFVLWASAGSTLSSGGRAVTLKPTVLLISLDGFRWDYLDRHVSPNINAIAARGVRAKGLRSVYPSETFPNHYSIVTGVYPEKHGIVKNEMYDPIFDAVFTMRNSANDSRWWGAEPIWITAEKQGQTAGVYFWVGSEAEVEGTRPKYYEKFDGSVPNSKRVDEVLSWLDLPDETRPTFIGLYFSDTDHAGHTFGPDSSQVNDAIKSLDDTIGSLETGLEKRNLTNQVNIIIVSDHGMAATNAQQRVFLGDYLPTGALQSGHEFGGTNALLWPVAGKEEEVYQALQKAAHMKAFRKQETPEYFHYRNNRRIAPIVCLADEGWSMEMTHFDSGSRRPTDRPRQRDEDLTRTTGAHGYDPRLPSMHGIFVAAGPAFRERLVVEPFENIQIYNLMCIILGLKPAPNDGNAGFPNTVLKAAH